MASFDHSYKTYIQPFEGGYVNNPNDKGGETYAGIARKFHPTWSGWAYIDEIKKTNPVIKTNTKFPAIQDKVDKFYLLGLWEPNNFSKIENQGIADILFDWYVNSGSNAANTKGAETYGVDEILNRDFGFKLPLDSKFDDLTIKAINAVDPAKLYNTIKEERKKFYQTLVAKDPTQQTFLKGWMNRINSFPDAVVIGSVSIIVLVIALAFVFLVLNK